LKRDPTWDVDWIRLMLYMPQPQAGDELSAIRAWDLVRGHPRRGELDRRDYGAIIDELKPKINCYGFGAVVEAFEVKDALMKVLAAKDRSPRRDIVMSLPGMAR